MPLLLTLHLIIIQSAFLRLWKITSVPPQTENTVIILRILSAAAGILLTWIVFYLAKQFNLSRKTALLSAWAYSLSPWAIEQGRIFSSVNLSSAVLFLSVIYLLRYLFKKNNTKLILRLAPFVFAVIPGIWYIKFKFLLPIAHILNNLFILISPNLLFYRNITFWWGGLSEFGINYVTFLPFFLIGLIKQFPGKKILMLFLAWVLIFSAFSPDFPESRLFYLSGPLWSILIGTGMTFSFRVQNKFLKTLIICLSLFLIYEYGQLLHYYFRHYPISVSGNLDKIHGIF